eukprot:TRINITY_DN5856_c0_g2_i3.p1 TRINITY_DN5856_c0_g2~~TRINITY_DN5856_c0_g2_i3.p1  ORF type:complete len:272 (-),score=74.72 TRINITY_DN5856_c0_g2_i3:48-863(-)
MKFSQRPAGPVFFYSNNLDEIQTLKGYGELCREMASERGSSLEPRFARLLSSLWYNNAAFGFNYINRLYGIGLVKSMRAYGTIKNIAGGANYLEEQKRMLLRSWANNVTSRIKRFKPRSTIRLASFLRTLARVHNPNEEVIEKSTRRILNAYERERELTRGVFDEEIREKSNRRFTGMSAHAVYEVSPAIERYVTGEEPIPENHKKFTKFEFPAESFEEESCQVRVDYNNYKMNVVSKYNENEIYGSLLIDDVSSIVLLSLIHISEPTRPY